MNEAKLALEEREDAPRSADDLRPLTRAMIEAQALELARAVLGDCAAGDVVSLSYGGRVLELRPLDTRRFVLHMSRFVSMN